MKYIVAIVLGCAASKGEPCISCTVKILKVHPSAYHTKWLPKQVAIMVMGSRLATTPVFCHATINLRTQRGQFIRSLNANCGLLCFCIRGVPRENMTISRAWIDCSAGFSLWKVANLSQHCRRRPVLLRTTTGFDRKSPHSVLSQSPKLSQSMSFFRPN